MNDLKYLKNIFLNSAFFKELELIFSKEELQSEDSKFNNSLNDLLENISMFQNEELKSKMSESYRKGYDEGMEKGYDLGIFLNS